MTKIMGYAEWQTATFGKQFMDAYADIHGQDYIQMECVFEKLYNEYLKNA